jgi:hypothetical protein
MAYHGFKPVRHNYCYYSGLRGMPQHIVTEGTRCHKAETFQNLKATAARIATSLFFISGVGGRVA